MVTYIMTCPLSPSEVVKRARAFFGDGGLDMEVSVSSDRCLRFADHGYVQATVRQSGSGTIVELETRLWDAQVRDFLATLTGSTKEHDGPGT
jgi:hypothetical protein